MKLTARLFLAINCLAIAANAQNVATVEKRIKAHLANVEKWSSYGMNSDSDKLENANQLLKKELLQSGRQPATLSYGFPRLKDEMQIVTSPDGRLRIYSWDCQTGGTMHDFDAVYQYRGKSGKVYTWTPNMRSGSAGGFYHNIFQVDSTSGPIYLGVSTFIASTSLNSQSIETMKIVGDKLVPKARLIRTPSGLKHSIDISYDFFTVVDRPDRPIKLFTSDPVRKTFSFPVVIEDDETPQGRVTNRMITYRFDGNYFVKVG